MKPSNDGIKIEVMGDKKDKIDVDMKDAEDVKKLIFLQAMGVIKEETEISLEYTEPTELVNGNVGVWMHKDVIKQGVQDYECHLVGYFVGTDLSYFAVNYNLSRMWMACWKYRSVS